TTRALTFSWLQPNKKYDLDTNTNGEHRAFVVTGQYEQVFPLDIYPLHLLKACMVKDLDEMEQLGLYEVAPEDFSLTEFICISKQPHQLIIREGHDLLQKGLEYHDHERHAAPTDGKTQGQKIGSGLQRPPYVPLLAERDEPQRIPSPWG